jgi:hypothetical protein
MQVSVYVPMAFLVLLLLLRLALRRTWLAAAALALLFGLGSLFDSAGETYPLAVTLWKLGSGLIFGGILVLCMLRVGLLGVMAGFFMLILHQVPLTTDLSAWYAGNSLMVLVLTAAMAVWAFYISLAGRRLFKDTLLES